MYTESFAGDIDDMLSSMVVATLYTLPQAHGRTDAYGFTRDQRKALEALLLTVGKAMHNSHPDGRGQRKITIQIDTNRKIVLAAWWQAANLYQRLTKNCFMAGMGGATAKPAIKSYGH